MASLASVRLVARRAVVVARVPTAVVQVQQKRWAETAAGADKLVPPTAGKATAASPKIEALVNDIAKLTLLETADLVALLKQKLNIADVQMAAPVAAGAAPAAAAAPAEAKPVEKTEFKVKLESFDPAQKVALIRAIKDLVKDLNLIAAKKFVEEAPKIVKEGISKDEAQKIKAELEKFGGKVVLE